MFPRGFRATVIQRMVVWGAMLAFLGALTLVTEAIHHHRMTAASERLKVLVGSLNIIFPLAAMFAEGRAAGADRHAAAEPLNGIAAIFGALAAAPPSDETRRLAIESDRALDHVRAMIAAGDRPQIAAGWALLTDARTRLSQSLTAGIEAVRSEIDAHVQASRRNKLLLAGLTLFLVLQIAFLEYRWLVRPIARLGAALADDEAGAAVMKAEAMRRDEVGALARALSHHLALRRRHEAAMAAERAALAERVARQDEFKRASREFQERIADLARRLETNARQMADASRGLASLSRDIDGRAGEAARSTQAASGHVDSVARSIGDVAATLAQMSAEAGRTSSVAIDAKQLVKAASAEAAALGAAVRAIEEVVALIQDVASQTNLLSLNATIEAARVGESGRGFAVVAAEVKQLATRAAQATEDVRDKLGAVTDASARIAGHVSGLVASIDEIDAATAAIADLMRRQDEASQTISSSTDRSASDVRSVSEKVERVACMIGEANKAVDLVSTVSAEVNAGAADLRAIVQDYLQTTEERAA